MNKKYKWMYYRQAGATKYLVTISLLITASIILSYLDSNWTHVSRMGGIITIFGASLMLRRLQRLGAVENNKNKQPLVLNGNQFNIEGMYDDLNEKVDSHAVYIGFLTLILGTVLWSYGDYVFDYFLPFIT
jgi:hypothetical protein